MRRKFYFSKNEPYFKKLKLKQKRLKKRLLQIRSDYILTNKLHSVSLTFFQFYNFNKFFKNLTTKRFFKLVVFNFNNFIKKKVFTSVSYAITAKQKLSTLTSLESGLTLPKIFAKQAFTKLYFFSPKIFQLLKNNFIFAENTNLTTKFMYHVYNYIYIATLVNSNFFKKLEFFYKYQLYMYKYRCFFHIFYLNIQFF